MANEQHSSNDNQAEVPFALKALVIGLGVIMIFMLVLMIFLVVTKKDDEPAPTATFEMIGDVPHIPLDLGAHARVRSTELERGILTLVVETDSGDKVVLFDVDENRVLSVLELPPTVD